MAVAEIDAIQRTNTWLRFAACLRTLTFVFGHGATLDPLEGLFLDEWTSDSMKEHTSTVPNRRDSARWRASMRIVCECHLRNAAHNVPQTSAMELCGHMHAPHHGLRGEQQ